MQVEKKQIAKEDGRYLVFYHFPDTATPEQADAFQSVSEAAPGISPPPPGGTSPQPPSEQVADNLNKDKPSV